MLLTHLWIWFIFNEYWFLRYHCQSIQISQLWLIYPMFVHFTIQIGMIGLVNSRQTRELSSYVMPQSICAVDWRMMDDHCDRKEKIEVLRILLFSQLWCTTKKLNFRLFFTKPQTFHWQSTVHNVKQMSNTIYHFSFTFINNFDIQFKKNYKRRP